MTVNKLTMQQLAGMQRHWTACHNNFQQKGVSREFSITTFPCTYCDVNTHSFTWKPISVKYTVQQN